MQTIARQLIAEEFQPGDTEGRAAFRVCEKLRRPLSTLAGVGGFRSLLSRALILAKAETPWLAELKINLDGSIDFSAKAEAALAQDVAAQGGAALISKLIGLLVTFIGVALTRKLVQDIWPKAALREIEFGGA